LPFREKIALKNQRHTGSTQGLNGRRHFSKRDRIVIIHINFRKIKSFANRKSGIFQAQPILIKGWHA
jgi:hypothetical protein